LIQAKLSESERGHLLSPFVAACRARLSPRAFLFFFVRFCNLRYTIKRFLPRLAPERDRRRLSAGPGQREFQLPAALSGHLSGSTCPASQSWGVSGRFLVSCLPYKAYSSLFIASFAFTFIFLILFSSTFDIELSGA
jgi:hypothetical protein